MKKLDSLVLMRALAAIAVCFCHFGGPLQSETVPGEVLTAFYKYGRYGVQIFFVVSGFVIPLSLKNSNYNESEYFRFLWKRTLRLHPPYIVSLTLTLIISYFSFKARGIPYPETIKSTIESFFYMHIPADNGVYWTLAIEAQYYIFIGIAYILVIKQPKISIIILVLASLILHKSQVSQYITFFDYFVYFLVGIIGFLIYNKIGSSLINYCGILVILVYTYIFDEVPGSIAALIAITFILWYHNAVSSTVLFLGEISYSLYLIHFPIGVKLINLFSRHIDPSSRWMLFPLALLLIIPLSWLFYKIVEKPFADLSNKVKYHSIQLTRG